MKTMQQTGVIKNLNESDKEIEFIEDNNIQLSVKINENNKTRVEFHLFKIDYVLMYYMGKKII